MKITCPQCQFSREVAEELLPTHARTATCPLCQHRFPLERPQPQTEQAPLQGMAQAKYEDKQEEEKQEQLKEEKQRAAAAYQEQSQQAEENQTPPSDEEIFAAFAIANPWEDAKNIGYFSAFFLTVQRILFAAPRFFAGLTPKPEILLALLFFVIITIIQIAVDRFWGGVLSNFLAPVASKDPQLQTLVAMLNPKTPYLLSIIWGTAFGAVKLLIVTSIFYVLFRLIAPQRTSFTLLFQIVAYGTAPILLCIVPGIGSAAGFVWSIVSTAIGCRYAMRLSWPQTLIGILPLYLIGIPLLSHIYISMIGGAA